MKMLFLILLIGGYVINMYFLTVDKETRDYQVVNKIGVVLIPLGAVMGYVYIFDKKISIKD